MEKLSNHVFVASPIDYSPLDKKIIRSPEGMRAVEKKLAVTTYDNGDVRFFYDAPAAHTVEVAGVTYTLKKYFSDKPYPLEKQADGTFEVTVSGIPKGFHYCDWFVDGVKVVNPDGRFYGGFRTESSFDIPEEPDDFYFRKAVPHGTIRMEMYTSSENSHVKTAIVYTPPGYEEHPERSYPVLYLQHGVIECETSWTWSGHVNYILDNLIAEKKCEEMIVVMNAGYALRPEKEAVFYPGDFDAELVYDCMPYIEKNFRVKKGRENTAVAGLSLGSAQAALSAAKHPDLFGYFGVFSGPRSDGVETVLREGYRYGMIFLSAGVDEHAIDYLTECKEKLEAIGNPTVAVDYPGAHEFSPWRHSLHDFAMLLFKDGKLPEYEDTVSGVVREKASPYTGRNQALTTHPLFHDLDYREIIFATRDGKPAGLYATMKTGTKVTAPGTVEFYYMAPTAERVTVKFDKEERLLEKQEDGSWTLTVIGVAPGFYYTEFYIDGVLAIHPYAQTCYGPFRATNFVEMEDPDFTDYYVKDVARGSLRLMSYESKTMGYPKPLYIYTPVGYDAPENASRKYPVLYIQHGGGENEIGWFYHGKLRNIMDNLIAEGRCEEMIVVAANGYSLKEDPETGMYEDVFAEEMVEEIVPFVDAHFRTIPDKFSRAMSGLSMGAMQSYGIVFKYPEVFGNAGFFSGLFYLNGERGDNLQLIHDGEAFRKQFKYMLATCGTGDVLSCPDNIRAEEEMKKYNVPVEFMRMPGEHTWTFWRKAVVYFLERVFK